MAQEATGYVGQRVEWVGPPQTGYVTAAYRAAINAGELRPPTADERLELATGELGTVIELVAVNEVGHTYAIQFDSGYELEVVLPDPEESLVRFLDRSAAPSEHGLHRRYVPARRRTPLGQLTRALGRALRASPDPR